MKQFWNKAWWSKAIVIFVAMSVVSMFAPESSYEDVEADSGVNVESKEKEDKLQGITAGQYKVGTDIDPGKYILEGAGYYEICTTSECSILDGELIVNDNFSNQAIIILEEGQYVSWSKAVAYLADEYPREVSSSFEKGYHEVGVDIDAGEYKLEGAGYYAICSKPSCDIMGGELRVNDNLTNGGYVTVSSGEYLIISGGLTGNK